MKMSRSARYVVLGLSYTGAALATCLVLGGCNLLGSQSTREVRGILVEPGTEILFELSRPIDPRSVSERHTLRWPELDAEVEWIPPTPPSDGKYPGGGGRWKGTGVVWASNTHVLYVAPDTASGPSDLLQLEPADYPKWRAEENLWTFEFSGGTMNSS